MTNRKSQATMQQMGGKGNLKPAPGKMGGQGSCAAGPTGGTKRRPC